MIPSFILTLFVGLVYTLCTQAEVAEQADAHDSKSCSFWIEGSIPSFGIMVLYFEPLYHSVRALARLFSSARVPLAISCFVLEGERHETVSDLSASGWSDLDDISDGLRCQ